MAEHSMAYVAFDTSKLHNAVALAEAGRAGEVRYLGEFENTPAATAKLVRKLTAKRGALTFCYEAGPTGYGLHRQIRQLGQDCIVVAPSLIPRKPGKRVKTNRLDALSLVKQLRAGDLTAVWVPDERHEAVREANAGTRRGGVRAASEVPAGVIDAAAARPALPGQDDLGQGAHGLARRAEAGASRATHCVGGAAGCGAPGEGRIERLEQAIGEAVPAWSLARLATALMALRGVDFIAATTLLAEIGDLSRFRTPRELMAWLGLVPSEFSTGEDTRRGPITKAGNRRARQLLIECAWSYRHPPRVGAGKLVRVAAAPCRWCATLRGRRRCG